MTHLPCFLQRGPRSACAALALLGLGLPAAPAAPMRPKPGTAPKTEAKQGAWGDLGQLDSAHFARALARLRAAPVKSEAERKAVRVAIADIEGLWGSVLQDASPAAALPHFEAAFAIDRVLRPDDQGAGELYEIGDCCERTGRYARAASVYRRLTRSKGFRGGGADDQATALGGLGFAYLGLHRPAQAQGFLRQALPLFRRAGDKDWEAVTLGSLGDASLALHRPAEALASLRPSLLLFRAIGDKGNEAQMLADIGEAYAGLHQPATALGFYRQSLPLYRQAGDRAGAAEVRADIRALRSGRE